MLFENLKRTSTWSRRRTILWGSPCFRGPPSQAGATHRRRSESRSFLFSSGDLADPRGQLLRAAVSSCSLRSYDHPRWSRGACGIKATLAAVRADRCGELRRECRARRTRFDRALSHLRPDPRRERRHLRAASTERGIVDARVRRKDAPTRTGAGRDSDRASLGAARFALDLVAARRREPRADPDVRRRHRRDECASRIRGADAASARPSHAVAPRLHRLKFGPPLS